MYRIVVCSGNTIDLSIGLELTCSGGSCGEIFKGINAIRISKTPLLSLKPLGIESGNEQKRIDHCTGLCAGPRVSIKARDLRLGYSFCNV